ncbi:MFS transporter [Sabulicella glaciei]|uniref:MFS transporter n=1 Tax=Sabulicella glaciei TaxID=2984948 RepID=A0ABT3NVL7_9PROT|nr:MFS transporter [Roseococcus sp. MDT2-1-1]
MSAAAAPMGLLALGGFATGFGMRLLDPLLPLMAAGFNTTVSAVAVLIAAFMLPYGAGQILNGPLGDRFGKPRVASLALLLYGSVTMLAVLSATLGELTAMRALGGLFAGAVIPLLMAHVGDSVPYEERQGAIGRFLTGNVMATMLAGPISGMLGEALGWRASFLASGMLAFGVGSLLHWRLVRGMPTPPRSALSAFAGYARLLRAKAGRRLMLVAALNGSLLFGGAFPFIPSFLIEEFRLSAGGAGLVAAGFGVGALLYTRIAKRLVARFGENGLLRLGGLSLAVLLSAIALSPHWGVVLAAQLCIGLAFFMFHGVLQARATEALPEARGTAVSAFAMALFLGQTVGSLVFAGLIAWVGYRWGFGVASLGICLLFAYAGRSEKEA